MDDPLKDSQTAPQCRKLRQWNVATRLLRRLEKEVLRQQQKISLKRIDGP